MKDNLFYEAVLEGRYQIPIEVHEDQETYVAHYTPARGARIEVRDSNRAEAHRRCTDSVIAAVRDGHITPGY